MWRGIRRRDAPSSCTWPRAGSWHRIRLADGTDGWLSPADAGEFWPFARVIGTYAWALSATVEDWQGHLVEEPGMAKPVFVPHDPRRRIVGYLHGVGPSVHVEEVPAYAEPSVESAVVTMVKNHEGRDTLVTYDDRVTVYSRRPGWSEVRAYDEAVGDEWRKAKKAWIQDRADVWRFEPATNLDPTGFANPWQSTDDHPIVLTDMRTVSGRLWLRVRVILDSGCRRELHDIREPPAVLAEGWMLAHDEKGRPAVSWITNCD